MRNNTEVKYNRWKMSTKQMIEALGEEMSDALIVNDTNTLRACMINIHILDHTLSVVKDWMEKGEGDGNQ